MLEWDPSAMEPMGLRVDGMRTLDDFTLERVWNACTCQHTALHCDKSHHLKRQREKKRFEWNSWLLLPSLSLFFTILTGSNSLSLSVRPITLRKQASK